MGRDQTVKLRETAERRQITILHCDIVNSTAIIDGLDPEEVLRIMEKNLDDWTKIVADYRGVFVGYTGDGFNAYFGYPIAREDAATDAMSAAVQVSRLFSTQTEGIQAELECRIGVATGRVVIGQPNKEQIGHHVVAFGSAPSLAARLEQAATPGHIFVDKTTMQLCSGQFEFREVGRIQAKGFKQDVKAWEMVRMRRPVPRFDSTNLSPYVGRDRELGILKDKWHAAVTGNGQVVVLQGEPGIGKSRLVFEFEQSLGSDLKRDFRFQCSSLNASTALHPWFHWVLRFADIRQEDNKKTVHAKLNECIYEKLGFSTEVVTLSEAIMGLGTIGGETPDEPAPEKVLTRLQRALVESIIEAADDAPLFILIEDIHWMDASTLSVVQRLIESMQEKKIFLVLTCRPDNVPSFDVPNVTELKLSRLESDAVSDLVATFISDRGDAIDKSALMSTIERCEGNPFFVEELSKHYLEHMTIGSLATDHMPEGDDIPLMLQGSLLERIDSAGKAKEIAQLASVIGPEFDQDILLGLSNQPTEETRDSLEQLCELNILSRNAFNDRVYFTFRHALLREAVYSSLLHTVREAIHLQVAPLLAAKRQTYSAEIIARHFEQGGDQDTAFTYWLEAGQHSLKSGATEEAVSLLKNAHRLTQDMEETADKLEGMASMYLAYGHALNSALGVVSEPIKYFKKAEELAIKLDNTEMVIEALDWQFGVQFNAGNLSASKEPAQKMKDLWLAADDREALASGFQGIGMIHFMRGELEDARNEFEQGLKAAGHFISGEHCFPSMSLSYLAWTYFILGLSKEAASCADRAIASARQESSHALATALSNCSYVYQCLGNVEKVYKCTGELIDHATKRGELLYLKRGTMTRNWADCISGTDDSSIGAIKEHIETLLDSKEEIEVTYHLGVLADLQIRQGQFEEALKSIEKALAIARKNGEN